MRLNNRVLLAFAILILGISISIGVQYVRNDKQLIEKTNQINLIISNQSIAIEHELSFSFSSVEILKYFFAKNQTISRKEFQNYTEPIYLENHSIKAISWVPKVTAEERTEFETEIRRERHDNSFFITERNDKNELIKATTRPNYFPVKYIEPIEENSAAIGYDIFSNDIRKATILNAINRKKIAITPRIQLVQDARGYGFLVLVPVFNHVLTSNSANRFENTKGFISAVYKVNQLIDTALLESKVIGVQLVVIDITTTQKEELYNNTRKALIHSKILKKQIAVGDRVWELNFIIVPFLYKIDNKYSYFLIGISSSLLIFILILLPYIKSKRAEILSHRLNIEQKVREKTEQSLSESEEYNRALFKQATIGLALTTMNGRLTDVNPAYAEIIGHSIEETLKLTYWEITPDKYIEQEQLQLQSMAKIGHYGPYEKEYIHKDGHLVPVRLQGKVIEQKGEKYILSSIEDITEQKRLIDEIKDSQMLLMNLINAIPDLLWLKDINGIYLHCNTIFEDLYGVKEKDLIGMSDFDLVTDPKRAEFFRETDRTTLLNGKSFINEEEVTFSSDGHHEIVETIKTPIFDFNDKITGVLGISRNITEHKKFESEIIRLNNHLQSLIEVIQNLAKARSLDEIVSSVKVAARKLTNADGATFILREGDKCYFIDEDALYPLWKGLRFPLEERIGGWAILNKEMVIAEDIYKDERINSDVYKHTFVNSLAMFPIRMENPVGVIGIYWSKNYRPTEDEIIIVKTLADATSIAMENVSFYEKLEIKVKDRTVLLEAANKELEAFSYSVSHDLRAPLRHINGYIDLLNRRFPDSLPEKGQQFLKNISDSATQMGMLIDDLLLFSRTSRQELRYDKLNMQILVQEVIKLIDQENTGRKIEWAISTLPNVLGDNNLLKLVWINLLSNAAKFTRKKDQASIQIQCQENEKEYIFSVRDNGAGFDMQYAQKLFGVFQRLHSSADYEGTGIGLANVQRIIIRHGGRTWAEAEVEKGATFYFTLPKNINEL